MGWSQLIWAGFRAENVMLRAGRPLSFGDSVGYCSDAFSSDRAGECL